MPITGDWVYNNYLRAQRLKVARDKLEKSRRAKWEAMRAGMIAKRQKQDDTMNVSLDPDSLTTETQR